MHSATYPQAVQADQQLLDVAIAVARNNVGAQLPLAQVLLQEGITPAEYATFCDTPVFKKYVARFETDLQENGFSTRTRAKILMQALFPSMFHLAQDPDVPAAARVAAFKQFVDLAGEAPGQQAGAGANGPGFSITISLPGGPGSAPNTVTVTTNSPQPAALEGDFAPLDDENRQKAPIFLLEGDDYEYAGEDYL